MTATHPATPARPVPPLPGLTPELAARLTALAHRSHAVIAAHQDPGGAYPASPTFSAYRGYAWLRDGSFTAEGVSRYGDVASAGAFHDWAAGVLLTRAGRVELLRAARERGEQPPPDTLLPTRFRLDGSDGSDPWWDFQTDGYGMWLWAVVEHARRHGLDLGRWAPAMRVATDYLTATWDLPCYDWWEEHVEQRHPSTLGATRAGLLAAAGAGLLDGAGLLGEDRAATAVAVAGQIRSLVLDQGTTRGRAPRGGGTGDAAGRGTERQGDAGRQGDAEHLAKWLGSDQVDASLAACVVPFGLAEPGSPLAAATLAAVAADLDVEGGVHRYRADVFYGGGRWPLLSCLLGWNLAVAGDRAGALRHLVWAAATADDDGELPEQVDGHLLAPDHRAGWVQRWGPVARPLLWSHGMYLILADELGLLTPEAS